MGASRRALTLVAPVMVVGLLILTVLAAIVLDDRMGPLAPAGVATLVCGVVLVALHTAERQVAAAGPLSWALCVWLFVAGAAVAFVVRGPGRIVVAVTTLVPIALVPVLFGEEWPANPTAAAILAAGVGLVATGVWMLARSSAEELGGPSTA